MVKVGAPYSSTLVPSTHMVPRKDPPTLFLKTSRMSSHPSQHTVFLVYPTMLGLLHTKFVE